MGTGLVTTSKISKGGNNGPQVSAVFPFSRIRVPGGLPHDHDARPGGRVRAPGAWLAHDLQGVGAIGCKKCCIKHAKSRLMAVTFCTMRKKRDLSAKIVAEETV